MRRHPIARIYLVAALAHVFNIIIMSNTTDSIGIIAGNRALPLVFASLARKSGARRIIAVGFHGETDPKLEELVDELYWIRVGQLGKLISALKRSGISKCVMAGQISPKNLFNVRPDFRAMSLLLRLKTKNAHTIFGGIADEMLKDGIELVEATPWLAPIIAGTDYLAGPAPTPEQENDIRFGFGIAKEISRLDIGQTTVVKNGAVLAVEGFEGTDQCLARGGELAGRGGGAVAVKVAKHGHDMRFDIPCIGPETLRTCISSGIAVLALEPHKTLLLEKDEIESIARKGRITVIGAQASSNTN